MSSSSFYFIFISCIPNNLKSLVFLYVSTLTNNLYLICNQCFKGTIVLVKPSRQGNNCSPWNQYYHKHGVRAEATTCKDVSPTLKPKLFFNYRDFHNCFEGCCRTITSLLFIISICFLPYLQPQSLIISNFAQFWSLDLEYCIKAGKNNTMKKK